ncbi:AbrB/MazE/SpoVT family DNA-binding domain-containing protein [Candidatus Woesearchaeota archaeon]|nr:AbrB/MazE/SpoVT family DNA-binding domain-containing protein [Candidatus Woesearchaeota archaeon]
MVILKKQTKIGPKGQVVIPQIFREALGLAPGEDVVVALDDTRIAIEKPEIKIEDVFRTVAKAPQLAKQMLTPHYAYESELESRLAKMRRSRK